MDLVSTDRDADAVRVGFLCTVFANYPGVGCFLVCWFGAVVYEVGSVGAHETSLFASLGQAC